MSIFIELLYYFKVVFTIIVNLYILKFYEKILFCIKRCIIIFSLNNLLQIFENHFVKFLFATECTGNHRLKKVNKINNDDSFNAFIIIVF